MDSNVRKFHPITRFNSAVVTHCDDEGIEVDFPHRKGGARLSHKIRGELNPKPRGPVVVNTSNRRNLLGITEGDRVAVHVAEGIHGKLVFNHWIAELDFETSWDAWFDQFLCVATVEGRYSRNSFLVRDNLGRFVEIKRYTAGKVAKDCFGRQWLVGGESYRPVKIYIPPNGELIYLSLHIGLKATDGQHPIAHTWVNSTQAGRLPNYF